jgi:hypothetical protein
MRKNVAIGLLVSCVLVFGVTQAYGWGSATHAYIDDHLGKKAPLRNLNEIYGGMAPDVFNYLFTNLDWLNYLYMETHYDDNIVLWEKAHTILEKAVAFGFVSHNGYTGADATAHGSYDYTLKETPVGWVIANAVEMANRKEVYPYLVGLNLVDENGAVVEVGYELCHTFVESAVDLLLARNDRSLGGKISAAALARTREFPDLLVKAYAEGFATYLGGDEEAYETAATIIRSSEAGFRKNMVSYGFALAQPPDVAKELIIDQLLELAPAFLGSYGIELDGLTAKWLKEVATTLMDQAIAVCEDGKYLDAVRGTISFVSCNLAKMHISY